MSKVWMAMLGLAFLVAASPAAAWGRGKRLPQARTWNNSKQPLAPATRKPSGPARLRSHGFGRSPLVYAQVSRALWMAHLR